jgi:hypothetical protein
MADSEQVNLTNIVMQHQSQRNIQLADIDQPISRDQSVKGIWFFRPSIQRLRIVPLNTSNIDEYDVESNKSLDKGEFKDDFNGTFPSMNLETYAEYKHHERGFFDIYQCLTPTVILLVAIFSRYNIYNSKTNGPFFNLSLFCIVFVSLLYPAFMVMKTTKYFKNNSKISKRFQSTWVGENVEDILTLAGTLMSGFVLYGRVFNGQCDSTSLWDSQVTNRL